MKTNDRQTTTIEDFKALKLISTHTRTGVLTLFPAPVFDHLQYARRKPGESADLTGFRHKQMIENWSREVWRQG